MASIQRVMRKTAAAAIFRNHSFSCSMRSLTCSSFHPKSSTENKWNHHVSVGATDSSSSFSLWTAAAAFGGFLVFNSDRRNVSCFSAVDEVVLGKLEGFEEGNMYRIKVLDGKEAVLLSYLNGNFYCTGASCTHFAAPLEKGVANREVVVCPWHSAEFDLKTGKCINGPALDNIPVYPVKVANGKVIATLPHDMKDSCEPKMVRRDPRDKTLYAIIGGGPSALMAAETLRQEGFRGRIMMISNEKHLPYDRCVISKILGAPMEKIQLRSEEFFTKADVECKLGVAAKKILVDKSVIELEDGTKLKYDKALVATGGRPRPLEIPGSNLENVLSLRTFDDSCKIAEFAKPGKRVVVIGSSFIGMESAAVLMQGKAKVSVVGPSPCPYYRVLGPKVGNALKDFVKSKGVEFIGNASVVRLRGDSNNKVVGVELSNGEVLQADAVVVGTGVVLNTEIVEGLTLCPDGSIAVDALLRAKGTDNLFAAGDVASFPYLMAGGDIRVEHWDVAMQHGRIAAKNMAGKFCTFDSLPFFSTMIFGKSVRYAGHCVSPDEVICEGDLSSLTFVAYYVKENKVMAVATMGMDPAAVGIVEAMKMNLMPSPSQLRLGLENSQSILQKVKDANKRPISVK